MYAGVFLLIPTAIFTYLACSLFNCSFLRHPHIFTPYSVPLLANDCIRKSLLLRLLIRALLNIPHVAFIAFIIFVVFFFMCFSNVFPVENKLYYMLKMRDLEFLYNFQFLDILRPSNWNENRYDQTFNNITYNIVL